eukprot:GEZU01011267.1.p1 GENE.GEZU01011267.1~~GEZU01011267.1.p1  ORF type:complete len:378 (-),score=86.25 GEZU01011267.1:52-1185(-)
MKDLRTSAQDLKKIEEETALMEERLKKLREDLALEKQKREAIPKGGSIWRSAAMIQQQKESKLGMTTSASTTKPVLRAGSAGSRVSSNKAQTVTMKTHRSDYNDDDHHDNTIWQPSSSSSSSSSNSALSASNLDKHNKRMEKQNNSSSSSSQLHSVYEPLEVLETQELPVDDHRMNDRTKFSNNNDKNNNWTSGGTSSRFGTGTGTGTGTAGEVETGAGGGALWGTYDEAEAASSFQEALREWRSGGSSSSAKTAASSSAQHQKNQSQRPSSRALATSSSSSTTATTEIQTRPMTDEEKQQNQQRVISQTLSEVFISNLRLAMKTTYFDELMRCMKEREEEEQERRLQMELEQRKQRLLEQQMQEIDLSDEEQDEHE